VQRQESYTLHGVEFDPLPSTALVPVTNDYTVMRARTMIPMGLNAQFNRYDPNRFTRRVIDRVAVAFNFGFGTMPTTSYQTDIGIRAVMASVYSPVGSVLGGFGSLHTGWVNEAIADKLWRFEDIKTYPMGPIPGLNAGFLRSTPYTLFTDFTNPVSLTPSTTYIIAIQVGIPPQTSNPATLSPIGPNSVFLTDMSIDLFVTDTIEVR
jgi:hypothetical protein